MKPTIRSFAGVLLTFVLVFLLLTVVAKGGEESTKKIELASVFSPNLTQTKVIRGNSHVEEHIFWSSD